CKKHLTSNSNRLWRLQETGFNPTLPFVSNLNPIEARLVSIPIPFDKIRELTYDGQYGLRGSVVNVLANLEKIQAVLPRFIEDEASVLVGIKRKLEYDRCYLSGVVRPLLTMRATTALLSTPLYTREGVTIND
ncbi:hypothetical protein GOP47_0008864, partial [Adiantum capillus-veneris]